MKKHKDWFTIYPQNRQATNLSIASGGVRLISILLLLASIPVLLSVIVMGSRIASAGGIGNTIFYLMEEMDDEVMMAFGLWCAAAVFRYAASVLSAKAGLLQSGSGNVGEAGAQTAEEN